MDDTARFSLLTFNINDDATSASSPAGWTLAAQHAALRQLVLEHSPDLLCLQECFSFPSTLVDHYDFHGSTTSHRGSCHVATRRGSALGADGPTIAAGPCILVPLRLGERRLFAASAHLAPFAEFDQERARQLADIVRAVPADVPLVLAGDTNMRERETGQAAANGLADAWLESGSPPEQRWSVNTCVNRYFADGHAFTARYDRLLYRGCTLLGFAVTADQPCSDTPQHYLSDHFGLVASLRLDP
ncbi:Tyrosyl-DNA phosphodiesterase 2 [Tetrabaena socialis]|uniref:Tyrosyl-DNA phosphodiesterase 2 n=1 Tax=Tetrabaena socialis TaxID=47790 RepID=A0A2J8AGN2_9CHLO|nr:Tyrosyl-DNA phosphodiesterase 2 [Tetrabaena socialis]|eukprot:PNH11679.1 Tyrosyl-DNA phosphodiesterase 2 [Tetrabaena socialis]